MIIELTKSHNGQHKPVWINCIDIQYMEEIYRTDENSTIIWFQHLNNSIHVMQTPEEILTLIQYAK
jgi:hypothetical protein